MKKKINDDFIFEMSSKALKQEYFNGITSSDLIENASEGKRVDAVHQFRKVKQFSFIRSMLDKQGLVIPYRVVFDMRKDPKKDDEKWIVVVTRDLASPIDTIVVTGSCKNMGYTYGYGYESKSSFVIPLYRGLGLMTLMRVVMMKVMDIHYSDGCEIFGYFPEYTASLQGSCGMGHVLLKAATEMGRSLYYNDEKVSKADLMPDIFQRGIYVIR